MSEPATPDLSSLLLDAEQRAGSVPALRERITELERSLRAEQAAGERSRRETEACQQRLVQTTAELASAGGQLAAIKGSRAWRVANGMRSAIGRGG